MPKLGEESWHREPEESEVRGCPGPDWVSGLGAVPRAGCVDGVILEPGPGGLPANCLGPVRVESSALPQGEGCSDQRPRHLAAFALFPVIGTDGQ